MMARRKPKRVLMVGIRTAEIQVMFDGCNSWFYSCNQYRDEGNVNDS
jgi:hypothetical protein